MLGHEMTDHLQYLFGCVAKFPDQGRLVLEEMNPIMDELPLLAQRIFEASRDVYSQDATPSAKKIWDLCRDRGWVECEVSLRTAAKAPSSMLWSHKAKAIVDIVRKRQIETAVKSINFSGSVQDVLDQVSALSKFSANKRGFFCDLEKEIQDILSGKAVKRITTGVPALDSALNGGLPLGDVSVVAGSTGSGKSAFALNIAYHVLKHQVASVTIYSLEMTASTNLRRMAAIHSGVSAGDIGKCESSKRSLEAFGRAYKDGLLKIRGASTGLGEIRSQAVMDGKWSEKPNLTIVDYTGLIQHSGKSSYERMSEISRELRQIALDAGSALLEVVQLNREYRKHNDTHDDERAPILSDLRDSGQIEQDASVILMIHSPKDSYQGGWSKKEIYIRKNRDGQVDDYIEMEFNGPTFKFREPLH